MDINVLYEDNHLIIVNKEPGDIVQVDKSMDESLDEKIKKYIKEKYNKPGQVFLGVVHRIDRPVSGAVVFARTSKSLERLNAMFKAGEIDKRYWAIVEQKPDPLEGKLEHYILRNEKINKSFAQTSPKQDAKLASLTYHYINSSDRYHLLEIELHTGRHHQIRCQLAAMGWKIKGDLKYGSSRSNPDGSISLHARSIKFIHPVQQKEISIVAPPPDEVLWNFFTKITL